MPTECSFYEKNESKTRLQLVAPLFVEQIMTKKHRILFSAPALYGHIGPALAIAKHLKSKGHTVGFCSGDPAYNMLAKEDIHDFYPRDIYHEAMLDKATFTNSPYKYWYNLPKVFTPEVIKLCLQELISAFESFKPDMVYIDCYDFLAVTVAEKYNLPYAHGCATTILYLEFGIPPIGTDWDIKAVWLNRLRFIFHLCITGPFMLKTILNQNKALKTISPKWKSQNYGGVSPFLFMLYSTDAVEYQRKLFIPQIFYVGPIILEPDENQLPDFPWDKLDSNRPLIYISTGTLVFEQYREFYQNALIALSEKNFPCPIQVVMAMGKQKFIDELGEIPPNFIVVPYAPQIKLLSKAKVAITHGGVNSVNETLIFGKPLLVVHWGADRLDMGRRITHKDAGICIDVLQTTPDIIKTCVIQLLQDPRYSEAAHKIKNSFNKCNGAETAAELILQVADTRKPILRKKGAPITLENIQDLPAYLKQNDDHREGNQ